RVARVALVAIARCRIARAASHAACGSRGRAENPIPPAYAEPYACLAAAVTGGFAGLHPGAAPAGRCENAGPEGAAGLVKRARVRDSRLDDREILEPHTETGRGRVGYERRECLADRVPFREVVRSELEHRVRTVEHDVHVERSSFRLVGLD